MKKPLFTGVCTALVTPFLGNQVNYPLFQQLVLRQIQAGIPAVVVAGTTGESPTLSDGEKIQLFKTAKETADNRCLVIAGTGSNSTKHAVSLSMRAQEAGADGLLIVSPYYNKATPEGLLQHYLTIAASVSIPIILYNVPSRTGVDIPISIYRELSKVPNIIGVKEASTDISKMTKINNACGPDFSIWSGNDELTIPAIALGEQGVISVTSNLFPEAMQAMAQAAFQGDTLTAATMNRKLLPVMEALFCEVNPIPVKYAMKKIGFDCGSCRLPLTDLSEDNQVKMNRLF